MTGGWCATGGCCMTGGCCRLDACGTLGAVAGEGSGLSNPASGIGER